MSSRTPLAILGILICGCGDSGPAVPDAPASVSAPIGEPLPALTAAELARFESGAAQFSRLFTVDEGLGPRFNEVACNACHTDPADGGTGEQLVIKASRVDAVGSCDLLELEGGPNLRKQVTPPAAQAGASAVPVPASSTHTGEFTTPFLFGFGMIDAIELTTLQALADPNDSNGDGISGRLGMDGRGSPARFGRKANVATLADFVDEAFRIEMGITTPGHTDETQAGGVPAVPAGSDPASDPEIDAATLGATVDFVRFLAPPEPAEAEDAEAVEQGRELFGSLGCAECHVPTLATGAHEVAALSERTIALYSDLLLHDMGAELVGPCATGADPQEYRTEPLMGLRYRGAFLHDGRAGRVRDAILLHGGEALAARQRFTDLDRVTQEQLIAFLGTI